MRTRSLNEELAINQFAQGVRSADDLLTEFSELDEERQWKRLFDLYRQVQPLALVEADFEQALADSSLEASDTAYNYLDFSWSAREGKKRVLYIADLKGALNSNLENTYKLLLYLFRIDYQRRFEQEKESPSKWWYQDLSDNEIVQGILTQYWALVDEVYATATFQSEFASLAKLWNVRDAWKQAGPPQPDPQMQTRFNFVTYNEMLNESDKLIGNKNSYAIGVLSHSLGKALSIRYKLDTDQTERLMFDVIEKHLQNIYNRGFCE
ncbi:DUF5958 family protein [Spirosoma soli]|uniref:DUF5958 family protein n=1 Tax=Spirosoma soli TaxID=1770529 RepID=A0ABW5M554_9BACT